MTSTTALLTTEDAKRLLEEIAAERGADFTYRPWRVTEWEDGTDEDNDDGSDIPIGWENTEPGMGNCQYKNPLTGEPDCIVGHLAQKLGVLDQVEENITANQQYWLQQRFDAVAVERIRFVQTAQDAGVPWGKAIEIGFSQPDHYGVSQAISAYKTQQAEG